MTPVPPPAGSPDAAVPWHFGDPLREQRRLLAGEAVVDLSHRGVVTVTGPDRLTWLHDLTTAELRSLPPDEPRLALILDPHGHVEHELHVVDDGETTWLTIEPGMADALAGYLRSMQFLLRVEVADATAEWAVVGTLTGTDSVSRSRSRTDVGVPGERVRWAVPPEFAGTGTTPAGTDRGGDAGKYVPHRPGTFPAVEHVLPRGELAAATSSRPAVAGTWAWEAVRAAAAVPRLGLDTDARTLPHEVGWIGPAVHLAKGCYRGQEAVARTHNMGRPPRRLVLLHLDGSAEHLPGHGADVLLADQRVGWIGTPARHYELGPVATAIVKHRTDPDAVLTVEGVAATQEVVVR